MVHARVTAPPKPKCTHPRAKAPIGHCRDCGKPTKSHPLVETRTLLGQPFEVPVPTSYSLTCPDCGAPVIVIGQAVQCHVCFEKAKALGGRESGEIRRETRRDERAEAPGTSSVAATAQPVEHPKEPEWPAADVIVSNPATRVISPELDRDSPFVHHAAPFLTSIGQGWLPEWKQSCSQVSSLNRSNH